MILDAIVETGNVDKALELAVKVAGEFSSRNASTQELAWTAKSMSALAANVGTAVSKVSFYQSDEALQGIREARSVINRTLDFAPGQVHILNNGESRIYTSLTVRTRADINEMVKPASNGVNVSVKWQTLDGKPLQVENLKQGTEFRAVITVNELTGTTSSESMALSFTAPSGWEIWNDRLLGEGEDSGEYRDIRDNGIRWYFTLRAGASRQFSVRLQAAYQGSFHLPEILCEDMYNADYKSNTASVRVCVSR